MERAKTVILILLVITSVILSLSIRSAQVPPKRGDSGGNYFGPRPAVEEVAIPGRVFLGRTEQHLVQVKTFSDLYGRILAILRTIEYTGSEGWKQDSPGDSGKSGIWLLFDYPVSRAVIAQFFMNFYEDDFILPFVSGIFIPGEPGPIHFVNTGTGETWYLDTELAWDFIAEVLADLNDEQLLPGSWEPLSLLGASLNLYDLVEPVNYDIPNWFPEVLDLSSIIQSFFLEPAMIRQIHESDGTVINTDGARALRTYPSGEMEYAVAEFEPGPFADQLEIIESSLVFISRHGGWAENMILSHSYIPSEGKMRLEYVSYGNGLPLYTSSGSLAVEVAGASVTYYWRNLIHSSEDYSHQVSVLPFKALISRPSTQIAQLFSTLSGPVTDLALGYYLFDGELSPVWRVSRDQQTIYASAIDGRVFLVTLPGRGN